MQGERNITCFGIFNNGLLLWVHAQLATQPKLQNFPFIAYFGKEGIRSNAGSNSGKTKEAAELYFKV